MAAEYIVSSGNPNVILCERGIRTFETYTRNTMDLAAVPLLDRLTHLPVIVDPSHATGKRWLVKPLALGGVAVGADGVMVEVHPNPDEALSDAEQQLTFDQFRDMMAAIVPIHEQVRGLTLGDGMSATAASGRAGRPRPGERPPARRPPPARRQVDQPSGADPGRAGRRREPDRGRRRRRRRALDGRHRGGAGRHRSSASPRTARRSATGSCSPGADGLRQPAATLDCGNSGTSLRLMAGVLAGLPMTATLDGDDSLRRRPVARIIEPLRSMGAVLDARRNDSLPPLTVVGRTPLRAIEYRTAVPSAQVKSAILLAGLRAAGRTTVRESVATRDHTERMLRARGVPVERTDAPDGSVAVSIDGGGPVGAVAERVPGDVSAAAFWLVAGAIHPDAELLIHDVGVNPTRRAVIDILRSMGADIEERAAGAARPTTASASRWPTSSCARRRSVRWTSVRPTSPRRSTRSRCSASPRRRRPARPSSAARASFATRNRTGSRGRRPGCGRSAPGSRSTATTSASRAARPSTAPRPTASTTTGWR